MSITTLTYKPLALALLAAGMLPLTALAALPSTSPYVTDSQNTYVQDATSDGIANLNMVLCIMDAMKPADMVNKGDYVALVDKNKCDTRHQSDTSNSTSGASGATSAPDYMTAVVNVSRASNSDPMIGKIWMSMTEQGFPIDISVHLTATQSPTDVPPYGVFRLDYIGKSGSNTQFNGFIDANGANVSYLESGANSSNDALALNAASTTSGSGTMQVTDQSTNTQKTFNIAYDSSEANFPFGIFRRDVGSSDACFDRSKTNASKSVWRYGTYNANDGTRVDQANPGFPIQAAYNGNTYYGYGSYWGVNFQGLNLNSFQDGLLTGVTIKDQRPGNTSTYALSKNSGKLTKWTQNSATLAAMNGIPFNYWGDLTGLANGLPANPSNSWQMQWDNANSQFLVVGIQACGSNGCTMSSITPPVAVSQTAFNNMPVSGWSNSFGGNITIPPNNTNSVHSGADAVNYYSQSDVIPGDANAPATLYCLSNCPTAVSVSGFTGNNSPFDPTTATQWNSGTVTEQYSFNSSGLQQGGTSLAITNASLFTGQYQNGVMSGRLFTTALLNSDCPSGTPSSTVCEPGNPSVYYTWQTGPNQWNQSLWLTNTTGTGGVVSFDAPENVAYTVPTGTAYGTWAGKTLQLQFNGFGNVQGIPGSCVSPLDNSAVDCNTAGARYVPAFSIPDGATMTLAGPNNTSIPLIVKALDAEMRLANVASCTGVTLAQPTTALTLPSATGLHDPSNPNDADYLGTEPVVTATPKVIQGIIQ